VVSLQKRSLTESAKLGACVEKMGVLNGVFAKKMIKYFATEILDHKMRV